MYAMMRCEKKLNKGGSWITVTKNKISKTEYTSRFFECPQWYVIDMTHLPQHYLLQAQKRVAHRERQKK